MIILILMLCFLLLNFSIHTFFVKKENEMQWLVIGCISVLVVVGILTFQYLFDQYSLSTKLVAILFLFSFGIFIFRGIVRVLVFMIIRRGEHPSNRFLIKGVTFFGDYIIYILISIFQMSVLIKNLSIIS